MSLITEDCVRQTTACAEETTFHAIVTESAKQICAGGGEGSREVRLADRSIEEPPKKPAPLTEAPRAVEEVEEAALGPLPTAGLRGCWGGRTSTGMAAIYRQA